MTVVKKKEPENPWDGIKLIVGVKSIIQKQIRQLMIILLKKVNPLR